MSELEKEAAFLKKWSKGKPIRLHQPGSTFWACGKFMTKLEPETVDGLVAAGFAKATRTGWIGWEKKPDAMAIVLGSAPGYDKQGTTEIVMQQGGAK